MRKGLTRFLGTGYAPNSVTLIQDVYVSSVTEVSLSSVQRFGGDAVGGAGSQEFPPNSLYPLKGSPGSFIVSLYDGGFTKMVCITFSVAGGKLYYAATGARYVTGMKAGSASAVSISWKTG